MNRYAKARKELAHYFAAFGDDLKRPAEHDQFNEYSLNAVRLRKRSAEAGEALHAACFMWKRLPTGLVSVDELRRACLAVVDVFEIYGAEWQPEPDDLE